VARLLESHGNQRPTRVFSHPWLASKHEHFLTHSNERINRATRGLKDPGIGTDYLMAVIYIKEFRNQAGVAAHKATTNKTDN